MKDDCTYFFHTPDCIGVIPASTNAFLMASCVLVDSYLPTPCYESDGRRRYLERWLDLVVSRVAGAEVVAVLEQPEKQFYLAHPSNSVSQ